MHVIFDDTLKAMNILGAHACERAGLSTLNEHARMRALPGFSAGVIQLALRRGRDDQTLTSAR